MGLLAFFMTISTSQLLDSKIVTKTATFGVVNPV